MASYLGTATCMLAASIWVAWHLPLGSLGVEPTLPPEHA